MSRTLPRNPLMIRLALHGCCNRPFFHIVVIHQRQPRNGRITEQIGTYDPMPNAFSEKLVSLNFSRLRHYLVSGAIATKPVAELLGLSGFLPIHPKSLIEAKRKRGKAAVAVEGAAANSEIDRQQTETS